MLGGLCLTVAPQCRADSLPAVVLSRGESYEQTDTNVVQLDTVDFLGLAGTAPAVATSVATVSPANVTNYFSDSGWPALLLLDDWFGNTNSLATNYPSGSYQISLVTTAGVSSASLALSDSALPPAPVAASWQTTPFVLLGADYRLAWTLLPGGAPVDALLLRIDQAGQTIFATPLPGAAQVLTGSSNIVVVPAGVFASPTNCEVSLTAFSFTGKDTNAIPGTSLVTARHRTTTFGLRVVDGSVPPPILLTTNLRHLPAGAPCLAPLRTTNGIRPLRFDLISGALPPGLSLDPGGAFTGETTNAGSFNLSIRVTDLLGRSRTQTVAVATTPIDNLGAAAPALTNVRLQPAATLAFDLLCSTRVTYTVEHSVSASNWATLFATNPTTTALTLRVPVSGNSEFFRVSRPGASTPPPAPLTVQAVLNTNVTASTTITPAGGKLSLTNQAGYVFSLSIPMGALDGAERITITDVSQVGGLPLSGGLCAAVNLQPEGLRLFIPARLDITSPTNLPAANTWSFGAGGDGSQFTLTPTLLTNRTVTLYLWHFSTAGTGNGTSGDGQGQAQHPPVDPTGWYDQMMAQLMQGCAANPNCVQDEATVWKRCFDNVVRPQLQQAETDDTMVDAAIGAFLRWLYAVELLGLDDYMGSRVAEGNARATKALWNALQKACDKCLNHDLQQVNRMMVLTRNAALLGYDDGSFNSYLWDCIDRCLRFRVELEAQIVWEVDTDEGPQTWGAHSKSKAKLRPLEGSMGTIFEGSGSWTIDSAWQSVPAAPDCFWQANPKRGRLVIPAMWLRLFKGSGTNAVYAPDVTLAFDSDAMVVPWPTEGRSVQCPTGSMDQFDTFRQGFAWCHLDEAAPGTALGRVMAIKDFEAGAGDLFLQKTYNRTVDLTGFSRYIENTTVLIWHTPGK